MKSLSMIVPASPQKEMLLADMDAFVMLDKSVA